MHKDLHHPPTGFTATEWNAVRSKLAALRSPLTRMAEEMKTLQQKYTNRDVAISGNHVAEHVVSYFLKDRAKGETLNNNINKLRDTKAITSSIAEQLHLLRELGNREKHANTDRKFSEADKPKVVHAVYTLAVAMSRRASSPAPLVLPSPSAFAPKELNVPTEKFPLLCGKQFVTANRLMQDHDVTLKVPRLNDVQKYVAISGTDKQMRNCMREMSQILYCDVRFRTDVPVPRRSVSPVNRYPYHHQGQKKKIVHVTSAARSFVLARRQQEEYKFNVNISKSPASNASAVVLEVKGDSASVDRACKYIGALQTTVVGPRTETHAAAARELKSMLVAQAKIIQEQQNNDVMVIVSQPQQGLAVTCRLVASADWPAVLQNAVVHIKNAMDNFTVKQYSFDNAPSLAQKFQNREEQVRMQRDYSLCLVAPLEPDFSAPVSLNVPWDKYGLVVSRLQTLHQSHPRVLITVPPRQTQDMANIQPITISTRHGGSTSDIVAALKSIEALVRQAVLKQPIQSGLLLCGQTAIAVEKAVEALSDMQRGLRPIARRVLWPSGSSNDYSWMKHLLFKALQNKVRQLQNHYRDALRVQTPAKGTLDAVTFHGPQDVVDECQKSTETWLLQKHEELKKLSKSFSLRAIEGRFLQRHRYASIATCLKKLDFGVTFDLYQPQVQQPSKAIQLAKFKVGSKPVIVRVEHGNILEQRVDAITNAANEQLDHKAALAGAVAKAAGAKQLEQESKAALARVSLSPGGAVSTGSLALQSRGIQRIVHAVAPHFLGGSQHHKLLFQKTVKAVLAEAETLQLASLAIPLIGSGIFGWPADLAAQLLTEALVAWLSEHPMTSLREICLVDVDRAKVDAMLKSLRSVAKHGLSTKTMGNNDIAGVKQKQWQWQWFLHESDKWVKYDEDQNVQLERAWYQHKANPSVTHCRIMGDKSGVYSDSRHKPEDAPGAVYDVFFAQMHQQNVVSKFTRPVQRCQPKSPLPDVVIPSNKPKEQQTSNSSSAPKVESKIIELAPNSLSSASCDWVLELYAFSSANVAAAVDKVKDEIKANWTESKEVDRGYNASYVSFSDLVAEGLREKVKDHDVELIDPSGAVGFKLRGLGPEWVEQALRDVEDKVRRMQDEIIERRLKPPSPWITPINNPPKCVEVAKDSVEWQKVVDLFNRHSFASTVKRVQRVENHTLWSRFAQVRQQVAQENKGDANEQWLIHGTNKTDPELIAENDAGIDPNYCDWGLFGRGSYFAEDADYSHRGYAFKETDGPFKGLRSMFLVRVVCGCVDEHKVHNEDTKKLRHPPQGHHSVRGPVRQTASGEQFAYVLYRPYHAFPEYLVTYDK